MVDTAMKKVLVLVWGHIHENGSIEHCNMCIAEDFLALPLIT
jgi:Icc-related predicted phosphoesterase